jgi:hypothetical protein
MLTLGNLKVNAVAVGTIIADSPARIRTLALWKALTWAGVFMAAAAYLVLVEARSSHRLLSKIRHEFLKGAIPYPAESVDQQHSSRV